MLLQNENYSRIDKRNLTSNAYEISITRDLNEWEQHNLTLSPL